MYTLLFILHLVISLLLCVVVLVQQSKGGGLAGAFGGGGGEAMFGTRGVTTFLHKATIYLGAAFMLSSVLLVVFSSRTGGGSAGSLTGEAAERLAPVANQPATPVATPIDDFAPAEPGGDATTPATDPATGGDNAGGGDDNDGGQ